jgi:predicted Fe-Mo cluster-binding NifX family protein
MEKIAIAVDNNQVSAHFGRCPSFAIIELQDQKVVNQEMIPNPGHRTGFLPKFLAEKDVHTIICGGMGRRAIDLFNEKGVKAIVGVSGGIDEVITKYIKGQLEEDDSLCQPGSGKGYGIEKEDRHHK